MSYWLDKMENRRKDSINKHAAIQDEISKALTGVGGDLISYIVQTMEPIEESHTQSVLAQGYEVRNYINEFHNGSLAFQFQGSVTNDTHVKAHSDIDLLVLLGTFCSLEPPLKPTIPYHGNPTEELERHRLFCEMACLCFRISELIKRRFIKIDIGGSKAIALSGSGLYCKVDVVPAHWHLFTREESLTNKGVLVFDKHKKERIKNTPFLHNQKIEEKDRRLGGRARRLMRLVKSIKYDSDQKLKISSYDLVSLVYNIPDELFQNDKISLAEMGFSYFRHLENNTDKRNALKVPDHSRNIFTSTHATTENFSAFLNEYSWLLKKIKERPERLMG